MPIKRNVRIIFGTDEESGMSCLKKYREIEQHPIAGFAPDATFPIINAEKGQIHVKCVMNANMKDQDPSSPYFTLLSLNAGTRANILPETATAYQEETEQEPTLLSSGENTYASLLPNCVAFGAVFPGKEMTAHQKDEYIEVDDLIKASKYR